MPKPKGSLGSYLDVPDLDAQWLAASGWTRFAISGPTTARPAMNAAVNPPYVALPGLQFLDTTLSKSIVFDGATWRDPTTGNSI